MIKIEKRFFFILVFLMGLIVTFSNYLVQFPVYYFNLQEIFTYGAFTYPIAFLITDLTNRRFGKVFARKIVYLGFVFGVILTLYFSTDFSNLISKRIALGSGIAFLIAQLVDVQLFDRLRKKIWFVAPLASSLVGSTIDTFLFFTIAFYGTNVNWISLSFGDLFVKILVAFLMLIPFRILLSYVKQFSNIERKISV